MPPRRGPLTLTLSGPPCHPVLATGIDFTKLDPRFSFVVTESGASVIVLGGGAPPAATTAPAGKKGGEKGEAKKGDGKKAKEAAPPADAVLGPDGKPLSKKDLRILERQKREVRACAARMALLAHCRRE